MKNVKNRSGWLTCVLVLGCVGVLHAQSPCPSDSLPLSITVTTDAWGYELYWELIEASAACGDGTALLWGGDPEVGCGDGVAGLPGEVYGNNTTYTSATICVSEEDNLVLIHRDSYGDGGSEFAISLGAYEAFGFSGSGGGNDWSFQPMLVESDLPCLAEQIFTDTMTWVGSTEGATVSPNEPAPPALGCGTYGGWCEAGVSNTLWLMWNVPPGGGVYEITTCNEQTTFDTQLALWRVPDCADFSSFELLNANDDIGCAFGAYRSGFLTPCLEGGETLYLQIDGYYSEVGTVEVSIVTASAEEWTVSASVDNESCSLEQGFSHGSITVNSNAGPDAVEWVWEGPDGFNSAVADLTQLLPGDYELLANFCGQSFSALYQVEEAEPIDDSWTVSANVQDVSCSLQQVFNPDGAINIQTNADVNAVDWQWTGPFGYTSQEYDLSPLLPGTYELSAAICGLSFSTSYEVEEPAPLELVVSLNPDCALGYTSGVVELEGGQGAVTATWTSGTFGTTGLEVSELPGGLFQVDVVDENGCEAQEVVWVESVISPEVDLGPDQFGCAGDAFSFLAPLSGELTYEWSTGASGALAVVQTDTPGTLVVGVEVTDGAGCTGSDAVILTLDDCTSALEDLEKDSRLNAYPNPFVDDIQVELPESHAGGSPQLRDLSGREVPCVWAVQGTTYRTHVDVPAGVYFLSVAPGLETIRLVKQ